nr:cellulose synthase-like protein D5 [Tanacetum cinerariifolium]
MQSGVEIHKELKPLNLELDVISSALIFLVDNPKKARLLFSYALEMQKNAVGVDPTIMGIGPDAIPTTLKSVGRKVEALINEVLGKFIVQSLNVTFLIKFLAIMVTLSMLALLEIIWSKITIHDRWRNEQFWLIGSAHPVAVIQGLLKVIAGVDINCTLTKKRLQLMMVKMSLMSCMSSVSQCYQ